MFEFELLTPGAEVPAPGEEKKAGREERPAEEEERPDGLWAIGPDGVCHPVKGWQDLRELARSYRDR